MELFLKQYQNKNEKNFIASLKFDSKTTVKN